uniref:ATP synthase complex subunit 8 n=1 Tax=Pselaphinae sp. 10 EF-2015 TaxID=1756854 RepID=A0A0S2M912_9COLE|nr:ATP synthase F0 subunit 8 [Pselaphinae sp. 10 EF-2015]
MPQMSPLNWIFLYMFFSMIFIMFNIMNYYYLNYKPKYINNLNKKNSKNWKW